MRHVCSNIKSGLNNSGSYESGEIRITARSQIPAKWRSLVSLACQLGPTLKRTVKYERCPGGFQLVSFCNRPASSFFFGTETLQPIGRTDFIFCSGTYLDGELECYSAYPRKARLPKTEVKTNSDQLGRDRASWVPRRLDRGSVSSSLSWI